VGVTSEDAAKKFPDDAASQDAIYTLPDHQVCNH